MTIAILLLSCVSAILYRAGGMAKDSTEPLSKWIPVWLRQSWVRDWLCPMCFGILFFPHNQFQWIMFGCYYLFTGISLSTYYDELFGYDNYWFAGLTVGLAGGFLFYGCPWYLLLLRCGLITLAWYLLSLQKNADIAEYGRGFILG